MDVFIIGISAEKVAPSWEGIAYNDCSEFPKFPKEVRVLLDKPVVSPFTNVIPNWANTFFLELFSSSVVWATPGKLSNIKQEINIE